MASRQREYARFPKRTGFSATRAVPLDGEDERNSLPQGATARSVVDTGNQIHTTQGQNCSVTMPTTIGEETPGFSYPVDAAVVNSAGDHRPSLPLPWPPYGDIAGLGDMPPVGEVSAFYAQGLYEDDGSADMDDLPDMVNGLFSQTIVPGDYGV